VRRYIKQEILYRREKRNEILSDLDEEESHRAVYTEIIVYFGIRDPNRICNWMSQYRKEGEGMFTAKDRRRGQKPKQGNTEPYIARLEMENYRQHIFFLYILDREGKIEYQWK